jgi:hypothetical protein
MGQFAGAEAGCCRRWVRDEEELFLGCLQADARVDDDKFLARE